MRILIIEDEKKVARFIERGLKEEHYLVEVCHDGEEGAYLAAINDYDLIILDVLLPKKDGFQVLMELRKAKNRALILMLTAKDTVPDRVRGLNLGADDYLTKPFAFEELLARARALLRRGQTNSTNILQVGDLCLDLQTHKVTRSSKEIPLTAKEYALLEYFMRNAGQIVTRTQLSEHVWDYHFDTATNVIDVYVHYLREKIDKGYAKQMIETVRGTGFLLKAEE